MAVEALPDAFVSAVSAFVSAVSALVSAVSLANRETCEAPALVELAVAEPAEAVALFAESVACVVAILTWLVMPVSVQFFVAAS